MRRLRMRGKRFVWMLVLMALPLALSHVTALARGTSGRRGRPPAVVTVRAGDSLWSLGVRFAPRGSDLRVWIYDVERRNGLQGAAIHPGQVLDLPS